MISSDPWANTLDGDFFDDSLQDTDFYDSIKMYSSMADLENSSDDDILEGLHLTHYKNVCFSMEDIFAAHSNRYTKHLRNYGGQEKGSATELRWTQNSIDQFESVPKRSLPTNVVKPTIRQSYKDIASSNLQPKKAPAQKSFAYKVSKI